MTELFFNAFFAVRGFHSNLLERARTERGASMVEYALLVGLIAVVAVVAVAALGGGIKTCSARPTPAWATPPAASGRRDEPLGNEFPKGIFPLPQWDDSRAGSASADPALCREGRCSSGRMPATCGADY